MKPMMKVHPYSILVLRHHASRTVYVRKLTTSCPMLTCNYVYKPLFDMLRRRTPYCERVRFTQVNRHIADNDLYVRPRSGILGIDTWYHSWEAKTVFIAEDSQALKDEFLKVCQRYARLGWFVLNTRDVSFQFFMQHFNREAYHKGLKDYQAKIAAKEEIALAA